MRYSRVFLLCMFPVSLPTGKYSFSRPSFPGIQSVQVSWLIKKIKEESVGNSESSTRRQLQHKITSLSQLQLARTTDLLATIWSGVVSPVNSSAPKYKLAFFTNFTRIPNWNRVTLALLKSISTGVFLDVQFRAFNTIHNNLLLDLRPLFASSVVIEGWTPSVRSITRKLRESSQFAAL